MARILSHNYSIARGSVAGITYTANQYHQIVARARTAPVQPGTPAQNYIRAALAYAALHWKENLTPAERADWDQYAQTCQYQGPLGGYTVPGRQIFIGGFALLKYMKLQGYPLIAENDSVPDEPGFYALAGVVPHALVGPGTGIAFDIINSGAHDIHAWIEYSIPYNQTRMRFQGPWDDAESAMVTIVAGATTTVEKLLLVEGRAYFVKVRAVVGDAGPAIAAPWTLRLVATTVP